MLRNQFYPIGLTLFFQSSTKSVFLSILFLCSGLFCNAQLPEYLELRNPKIQGECIASGGRVWKKATQKVVLSVGHETFLTLNSIFYSDEVNTFIHRQSDGQVITQIPGKDFKYNEFSSVLWNYSNNKFNAYNENGLPIVGLTFSGDGLYPYEDQVRFVKNGFIYKYAFTGSSEEQVGSFAGAFSTWFLDGEYFLTKQGSVVRLYDKNANLIKLIDMPSTDNLGGSGSYFWTYPMSGSLSIPLTIRQVNGNAVYNYPVGTLQKPIASSNNIAIFPYGESTFSIIDLTGLQPTTTNHQGSGPYLESYNSDRHGNWTTGNASGVVNYGSLTSAPKVLNLGKIRSMFGNESSNLAIATSSGHVLLYKFQGSTIAHIDTIDINAGKVKLTADGKYLAASGNTSDAQYSGEGSLYVYDVINGTLIKKWYYDHSSPLRDFDFSNDGNLISQKTSLWNGVKWTHYNFLSGVHSNDSVFLNHDDSKTAPLISLAANYAITSFSSSEIYSTEPDVAKLYTTPGILANAFTGYVSGWISDTKFVFNRMDSITCSRSTCIRHYSPHIYSVDGQEDKTFIISDSISSGTRMVKTRVLDPVMKISDHELYVNNSNVIDIESGQLLFAFDTIPQLSAPVGSDYIAFVKDNKLQIINWRSLSTKLWYRDADGDEFGDGSVTKMYYKKPQGYVNNASDCNDLDISINPNTKWYRDQDGDGYGDATTSSVSCAQPTGYVIDNTDCDDTDESLTPLNSCIITAVEDAASALSVFPNPGKGIYYTKYSDRFKEIKVINRFGQVINANIVKNDDQYIIDISNESAGLYILKIQEGKTDLHVKIIKQ